LLLVAGCGGTHGVKDTLLVSPVATSTPQPTAGATAIPSPRVGPISLVILHTNDNWGETEPCG